MASMLAVVVFATVLSAVIYLPRSFVLGAGPSFEEWQRDRRLWSSLALGSLLAWVGGATGDVFETMAEPRAAESAAVLLALGTGVWWLTLRRTDAVTASGTSPALHETGAISSSQSSVQADPVRAAASDGLPPEPATGSPPPGWYSDPWRQAASRRWNGLEWTTDTRGDA